MKIRHVTIQTASFEKEIQFYEKYAGLKIQRDMRPMGRNMVFLSDAEGDTEIEIIENPDAVNSGNENLSIGFQTDDPDAICQVLTEEGFSPSPFVSPAPTVRFFFVTDPAGVKVQFIS